MAHARVDAVHHVAVAVVVVPHVLLIGVVVQRRPPEHRFATVLHDDVLAVGIDRRPKEEDHVVEDLLHRRIVRLRQQLVRELRRVLRPGDLAGVQAAADVDEDLALTGKAPCRRVGETLGVRDAHVDLAVVIQLRVVLRRCDDRRSPWPPERRRPDVDQVDAIARRRQLLEVVDRLFVVDEVAVLADRKSENGFRRGKGRFLALEGAR